MLPILEVNLYNQLTNKKAHKGMVLMVIGSAGLPKKEVCQPTAVSSLLTLQLVDMCGYIFIYKYKTHVHSLRGEKITVKKKQIKIQVEAA